MTFHKTVSAPQGMAPNVLSYLDREADGLDISFYVEMREEDAKEPLVFASNAPAVPPDALKRLIDFAESHAVTIYIHPPLRGDHSEHAVITGPSSKQ